MIQIHKGAALPSLVRAGEAHVSELCAAYDDEPELYRKGELRLSFRDSIYASPVVKADLELCHRGKCCYCETVIPDPYAHAHIEHWRPKASSCQGRGEKSIQPGYYWLAYRWENLLYSCAFCNRRKADIFPLENPAARARDHRMAIEDERPAILKPDGDVNPQDHITFRDEVAVGLTPLGENTIDVLCLDDPRQKGWRKKHLDEIRNRREFYLNAIGSLEPYIQHYAELARRFIEEAARPEKPYSAMIAAFLAANPLPDRLG